MVMRSRQIEWEVKRPIIFKGHLKTDRIEISVFEQEIQDFPGVGEEKQKYSRESAEKTQSLQITTPFP
jgi:hypothetical protein